MVSIGPRPLASRLAVKYGERVTIPKVKLGEGLVGYAALHKQPVLVADVSADPRYIKVVEDVRSELVVPMLLKDRCIGVFDLERPELEAFDKRHVEILTLLAGQAAVAIVNARLYEAVLEAMNEGGEEFTTDRLLRVIEHAHSRTAREMVTAIFQSVDAFRGDALHGDDMTVVVVKVTA